MDRLYDNTIIRVAETAIHAANVNTPEAQDRIRAYYDFLAAKADIVVQAGFEVQGADLHPSLLPHQRDIAQWLLHRGRGLNGSSFGMGKTRIQLETLRLVHERTGQPVLQIVPLGARHQFTKIDGPALGLRLQYVTSDADIAAADTPYRWVATATPAPALPSRRNVGAYGDVYGRPDSDFGDEGEGDEDGDNGYRE